MAITKSQAETQLAAWLAADTALAAGQSYSIGNRQLTRVDAAEVRKNIEYWSTKVDRLSDGRSGGGRVRYLVPE